MARLSGNVDFRLNFVNIVSKLSIPPLDLLFMCFI